MEGTLEPKNYFEAFKLPLLLSTYIRLHMEGKSRIG